MYRQTSTETDASMFFGVAQSIRQWLRRAREQLWPLPGTVALTCYFLLLCIVEVVLQLILTLDKSGTLLSHWNMRAWIATVVPPVGQALTLLTLLFGGALLLAGSLTQGWKHRLVAIGGLVASVALKPWIVQAQGIYSASQVSTILAGFQRERPISLAFLGSIVVWMLMALLAWSQADRLPPRRISSVRSVVLSVSLFVVGTLLVGLAISLSGASVDHWVSDGPVIIGYAVEGV